jgi:hypothetical protein
MKVYNTLAEANRDGFFNLAQLSRLLGKSRQCVHAWTVRERTSKFPKPTAMYKRDILRLAPVYNLKVTQEWYRTYVPHSGGRPVVPSR